MAIFVTGATGFLGQRLASDLLEDGREVYVLARGPSATVARDRVERLLSPGNGARRGRLRVCHGRLDAPRLSLCPTDREEILSSCDEFIHCGANVRFDLPLDQAQAVNVGGTAALLELARERAGRGGLKRFHHVSTAYVAGNRTDVVGEEELDGTLGHKNSYERTKFEGELAVRRAASEIPVTIYRPSIVVGDSETGTTTNFNALYWPAKVYALGLWRICPGRADTPVDLVPVNFVASAIRRLGQRDDTVGRCFHLTAGPEGSVSAGQIADLLHRHFPRRSPVRFVDPDWWLRYVQPVIKRVTVGRLRDVFQTIEYFIPYFSRNPHFDNRGTRDLLAGSGVGVPSVYDYAERLFAYCVESDWGRKPIPSQGV